MTNYGTLNATTGANQIGTFVNHGTVDIATGVTLIGAYNNVPTFSATSILQGNGTFKTAVQNPYTYNAIVNPGTDGTIGSFTFDTWDANYSRTVNFSSTTVYSVDIAGTGTGGTNYDLLTLATAHPSALDGTLNLKSISGYTATSGDSFSVLNYTTGTFGTFTVTHDFGAGWNIAADYGTTSLTLTVLSDANAVTGTAGNDTLLSLASSDTIDGGAGTDTLHLNGGEADYTYGFAADGTLTLSDNVGTDGTDAVSNVETLNFTDGAISVATLPSQSMVNTTTSASGSNPGTPYSTGISVFDDGTSLVYWQITRVSGDMDMMAQRLDTLGQPVGAEFQLNDSTATNATLNQDNFAANFAPLQGGGFASIWHSVDQAGSGSSYDIVLRLFNSSDSPGSEILVNTTTTNKQLHPEVVQLSNGDLLVSWMAEEASGGKSDIIAQRLDSSGNIIGGEFTINQTGVGGNTIESRFSDITALDNGGFAVIWDSEGIDGSGNATVLRIYDSSGTAVTNEIQVNTSTTNWQEYPHIAKLENGNVAVVWQGTIAGDAGYGVGVRIFDSAGTAVNANEILVNTTTTGIQGAPQIAALGGGGFVVVWHSDQNGTHDVFAQRFDAGGTKVGVEFLVNDASALEESNPDVVGTFDGGFSVTWNSSAVAGPGDVYTKHFDASGNAVGYASLTGDAGNNTFNIAAGQ
ncbi:MAG: hypothetical protein JKY27_03740, partial [Magnetovibrio sp.]|nr:hypothetical protein [Magnetovibrio sp.]